MENASSFLSCSRLAGKGYKSKKPYEKVVTKQKLKFQKFV